MTEQYSTPSHRENTSEHLSCDIERNNGKGKQHNVSNHIGTDGMGTEHRSAVEDEQDLYGADRKHDKQKAFVLSDMRQKTNTARSVTTTNISITLPIIIVITA